MKIKLSKTQWQQIGKTAGWLRTASDTRTFLVAPDTLEFIEREKEASPNQEVWSISYDHNALNDNSVFDSVRSAFDGSTSSIGFYIQYFQSCGFHGTNLKTNKPLTAEDIVRTLFYHDQQEFWNIIRQSDEIYSTERAIEKRDIEMGDDQSLGYYDVYGPDAQKPQF